MCRITCRTILQVAKKGVCNNDVCQHKAQLPERLDQAILDVISNPKRAQNIGRIGT